MRKKENEKELAIKMRKNGCTYKEILDVITVSKGSLSLWLKKIKIENNEKYTSKINQINNTRATKATLSRTGIYVARKSENICGITHIYCYNCKQMKPLYEFNNRKGKFYKSSWCKQCLKDYVKKAWNDARIKLGGICGCGCNNLEILEIHHINHDGKDDLKINKSHYKIYSNIVKMPLHEALKKYKVVCKVCHTAYGLQLEKKYVIKYVADIV